MQRERAEHDVVASICAKRMKIRAVKINLGIFDALLDSDRDCRRLEINGIDGNCCAHVTREACDQPGNIARSGGEIEDPQVVVRSKPALQEITDETITPK